MASASNLRDQIPRYQNQDERAMQYRMENRPEYVAAPVSDEIEPGSVVALPQQRTFATAMQIFDRVLLISDPGTGKTRSFLMAAEEARLSGCYRGVRIFEERKAVINDIKRELLSPSRGVIPLSVRNGEHYRGMNRVQRNRELMRNLGYRITTYGSLVTDAVPEGEEEENWYHQEFDGRIIIFDEAHNIVVRKNEAQQKAAAVVASLLAGGAAADADALLKARKAVIRAGAAGRLDRVRKIAKHARRAKIILVTATPMIDKIWELAEILSIVLPPTRQFLLARRQDDAGTAAKMADDAVPVQAAPGEMDAEAADDAEAGEAAEKILQGDTDAPGDFEVLMSNVTQAALGYVSFVSATESSAKIEYQMNEEGRALSKAVLSEIFHPTAGNVFELWASKMGPLQEAKYIASAKSRRNIQLVQWLALADFGSDEKGLKYSPFKTGDADGSIEMKDDTAKWLADVLPIKRGQVVNPHNADRFLRNGLPRPEAGKALPTRGDPMLKVLCDLSGKYHELFCIENLAWNKGELGTTFVYLEYRIGPGCMWLSYLLTVFGWEAYVPGKESTSGRPQFAMMHGGTSPNHMRMIQKVFNDPDNVDGKKIRLVIGTEVVREGVSFYNATRMHILIPPASESAQYQLVYRIMRVGAHNAIAAVNKDGKPVVVRIFRHAIDYLPEEIDHGAATAARDGSIAPLITMPRPIANVAFNVDTRTYLRQESKARLIRPVMQQLKKAAFDCRLNLNRNTAKLAQALKTSRECDFATCVYTCGGEANDVEQRERDVAAHDSNDSVYAAMLQDSPETMTKIMGGIVNALLANGRGVELQKLIAVLAKKFKVQQAIVSLAVQRLLARVGPIGLSPPHIYDMMLRPAHVALAPGRKIFLTPDVTAAAAGSSCYPVEGAESVYNYSISPIYTRQDTGVLEAAQKFAPALEPGKGRGWRTLIEKINEAETAIQHGTYNNPTLQDLVSRGYFVRTTAKNFKEDAEIGMGVRDKDKEAALLATEDQDSVRRGVDVGDGQEVVFVSYASVLMNIGGATLFVRKRPFSEHAASEVVNGFVPQHLTRIKVFARGQWRLAAMPWEVAAAGELWWRVYEPVGLQSGDEDDAQRKAQRTALLNRLQQQQFVYAPMPSGWTLFVHIPPATRNTAPRGKQVGSRGHSCVEQLKPAVRQGLIDAFKEIAAPARRGRGAAAAAAAAAGESEADAVDEDAADVAVPLNALREAEQLVELAATHHVLYGRAPPGDIFIH